MGHTAYSSTNLASTVSLRGYDTKSTREIFTESHINNAMDPHNLGIRESRDSKEHPESLAIILALDVTGSMGSVPHFIVKNGLMNIMDGIIDRGILHPQILFAGIGDHECGDNAPLQVGQFESGDDLLIHWLEKLYLEGGGGGNDGESYMLAWYLAAKHTAIDCFEKRNQKGFLFTIGDEPVLPNIPANRLKQLIGDGQFKNFDSLALLNMAREKWNVFHIHLRGQTSNGQRMEVMDGWKQIMGENLLIVERQEEVAKTITNIVAANVIKPAKVVQEESSILDKPEESMML